MIGWGGKKRGTVDEMQFPRDQKKKKLQNRANNRQSQIQLHTSVGEGSPVGGKRLAGGHSDVANRFLMMSTL